MDCPGGVILEISKYGYVLNSFTTLEEIGANGILYDYKTDSLWVLTGNNLVNVTKNGDIITSFKLGIENEKETITPDQLCYDLEGRICFTADVGADYQEDNNWLYCVQITGANLNVLYKYCLKESYAVEGAYFYDNRLYVVNDGLYHNAKNRKNCVCIYEIE